MNIETLYEDNHLLCVVKPRNMPVQADASGDPDLLSVCRAYIKDKYSKPGDVYLGLVHRLDRPVGGVMVFARTSKSAARLCAQISAHAFEKTYFTVVCGEAPKSGSLEDWLYKDEATHSSRVVLPESSGAKKAALSFECLGFSDGLSMLRIKLETGRHHQIRVQLAHAGLPIWGDQRYNTNAKAGQQLALYAGELTLLHPTQKTPLTVRAPFPNEYPWNMFEYEKA